MKETYYVGLHVGSLIPTAMSLDAAQGSSSAVLTWVIPIILTGLDVLNAYSHTMTAAENAGCPEKTRERVRALVARETFGDRFVTKMLRPYLGLS